MHACLSSLLHAGLVRCVALEYRHIPALAVLMPAGCKLLVVNPQLRRGVLLLQKENVIMLGGVVSGWAGSGWLADAPPKPPPAPLNTHNDIVRCARLLHCAALSVLC